MRRAEINGIVGAGGWAMRNRLINGDMRVDQRNAGASVTAGSAYTLDRWNVDRVWSGSTVTIQQSTTAPAGFSNSLSATVSTGAAAASGSYFSIQQFIEAYNIADMAWGTASASQFTVSFWVRSSVTGTFGVCFRNSAFNLSYCTTYTVNAANTWELKSVTIAAPTSGTWGTGNSYGINVIFSLGGGSSTKPAANNTWTAGSYLAAIGETDLIATTGATFYITGIQLEKGSYATPFDFRPIGTELALCQRYYYRYTNGTAANFRIGLYGAFNTTRAFGVFNTPVPMRTSYPTGGFGSGTYVVLENMTLSTTLPLTLFSVYGAAGNANASHYGMELNVASGLVAGNLYHLSLYNGGTAANNYIELNAEL
jgi:hypothetical protein